MRFQVLRPVDLGSGIVQPGEIVTDDGWADRRAQQMVAQRLITPADPFQPGDPVPTVGRQTQTQRRGSRGVSQSQRR